MPFLVFVLFFNLVLLKDVVAQNTGTSTCQCDYTITQSSGNIQGAKLKVQPGQTICVQAGQYNQLRFVGIKGAPGAPIRIINCGGLVDVVNDSYFAVVQFIDCQYFVMSGSGDANYPYGFRLNNTGTTAGSTLNVTGRSTDFELERVEVSNNHFSGIMIKQDPGCDTTLYRGNFTMYNVNVHDNYVHDTGGEGLYIGNSFWGNGVTVTCDGTKKTVYPHEIWGLQIHHNRVQNTGCEGIQYGCSPNASVHHNTVTNAGADPFAKYQMSGMQMGEGSSGACYGNIINGAPGNGLVIVGYANNVKVYNNVITNIGSIGIFADERTGWVPNTQIAVMNNTITACGADGIKLYTETSTNTIANNIIAGVGNSKYITLGQGAVATQLSNIKSARMDTLGFVDAANTDYRLTANSFLINKGSDMGNSGILTDMIDVARPSGAAYDVGAYEYAGVSGARRAVAIKEAVVNETVEANVIAFPTPCREQITFKASVNIERVRLYDMSGSLVQRIAATPQVKEVTVATSNMPAGSYIYILKTAAGVHTGRFIKQ